MKVVAHFRTCRHHDCGEGPTRTNVFPAEATLADVMKWAKKANTSAFGRCSDICINEIEEEGDQEKYYGAEFLR